MNRVGLLAIGTMLLLTLTATAQQTANGSRGTDKEAHGRHAAQGDLPTVEQQVKVLADKLELTPDQQTKIKPIVAQLHEATEKVIEDKSLSREERLAKVRPDFEKADKQIREMLSDDQKKKLDHYEQGPHAEMHGSLSGTTGSPQI